MIKSYVVGFAFNEAVSDIVMILKNRPNWQAGQYNGIGGKVEEGESATEAMIREFEEETGVKTVYEDWGNFATLIFTNDPLGGVARISCFRLFNNDIARCVSNTDEAVSILPIKEIWDMPIIKHLHFLIPMAMDKKVKFSEITIR